MFPFARSIINKGKQANPKKKHLLKHLETSSVILYLSVFQRLGEILPFAESLINKGKHQNYKKKHLLKHLETSSKSLYLSVFQRLGEMFPFPRSLINEENIDFPLARA